MSKKWPCFSAGHCSLASACFAFRFFAGCQPVELSRGCIRCFPPCMQQRVGQLQIDLTHRDQLAEILTQITPCMQAALPYVLAVRPPAAAHGKAAKGPHSPQLLTGVGSQHLWSVHFSGMGSLCDMRCSYRDVALQGRLCDDQTMLMGGRQGAAAAAPPAAATATSGHWQLSLPPRLVPLSAHA
jgi:hypothetical protein